MAKKKIEPSGEFLLEAVIQEMADSIKHEEQILYLRERAIPFITSRTGRPLVKVQDFYGQKRTDAARTPWQPPVMTA